MIYLFFIMANTLLCTCFTFFLFLHMLLGIQAYYILVVVNNAEINKGMEVSLRSISLLLISLNLLFDNFMHACMAALTPSPLPSSYYVQNLLSLTFMLIL